MTRQARSIRARPRVARRCPGVALGAVRLGDYPHVRVSGLAEAFFPASNPEPMFHDESMNTPEKTRICVCLNELCQYCS
eukprot:366504-Chlamydomonas_euryale.AAC.3